MNNNIIIEKIGATILPHAIILSTLVGEIKEIDFYQIAVLPAGEEMKLKHYIIISIQEILKIAKNKHWSLCRSDNQIYIYNGAYWKQLSKEELVAFLGQAAENLGVDVYNARYYAFKDSLLKQFISTAFLPKPVRNGDEVLINLINGTFVITPDKHYLRNFEKEDFLTYQLPFEYQPDAQVTIFQSYLDKVLPDIKQQMILAEFISYVFIKQKTLKLEKSLILYGSGANGKSVFFEVITALLSNENVTSYSLQSLTDDKGYSRAKLSDKLLNYASEISPHMDSTVFKALVSGEPVEARLPYAEPFILEDYAKLIFNTNELPRDVEQTEAFFRRFIILHFDVTIPEQERDPQLSKKIIESELPGVFNWVLKGLNRLLEQKKFTQSDLVDDVLKNYRLHSDSVQLYLSDEEYEISVTKEISLKILYTGYRDYCSESGNKPCSRRVFSERLKNYGFTFNRKRAGYFVDAAKKVYE
jgi:putative DNA primase/helicase